MKETFSSEKITFGMLESTHREIISKSYEIKPKSDCIYQYPIDLVPGLRVSSLCNVTKGRYKAITRCVIYAEPDWKKTPTVSVRTAVRETGFPQQSCVYT